MTITQILEKLEIAANLSWPGALSAEELSALQKYVRRAEDLKENARNAAATLEFAVRGLPQ